MSEVVDTIEQTTAKQDSLLSVTPELSPDAEPEAMPHLESDGVEPLESDFEWGDRPDFMEGLDQFWSSSDGPDLEGLAKSYTELRAKMSSGKHKAPKDGKYDMAVLQGVPEDDPLLKSFTAFAKDNGLSQDQFEQISKPVLKYVHHNFKYGATAARGLHDLHPPEIPCPAPSVEPVTEFNRLYYTKKIDDYIREETGVRLHLEALYGLIWGQCTNLMCQCVQANQQ